MRFNLDWVTAICHIKERKSVISNVRKPAQIKVIYQFYYQNRARVLNETRPELRYETRPKMTIFDPKMTTFGTRRTIFGPKMTIFGFSPLNA